MAIILDGTTGITAPDITSAAGLDAADLTGTVASARLPAGSVIQVVQVQMAQTTVTISSTTFVNTGLTASITTTLANSKILASISGGGFYDQGSGGTACWVSLDRNFNGGAYAYATGAYGNNYGLMRVSGDGNAWNIIPYSGQTIDVPNQAAGTVINYRVLARMGNNPFQFQSTDRGQPTLTLMEIAA